MPNPRISIKYNFLMEPYFRQVFAAVNAAQPDKAFPDTGELVRRSEKYAASWKNYEQRVLDGMQDVLGLRFYPNAIDVSTAFTSNGSFSRPMVLHLGRVNADSFIDLLTHELIHVLLTDNTADAPVGEIWARMFPDATPMVRNHVVLHAAHQSVIIDILDEPHRLAGELKMASHFPEYKRSWDIVAERGYRNVIEEFKSKVIETKKLRV